MLFFWRKNFDDGENFSETMEEDWTFAAAAGMI